MSFLAPSLLWGLLAATIPVLIHLISNRRTKRMDFSAVRFIKELEHDTIRKLKLRQIILLVLRTLAVIALVLSFARPVKIGYFPLVGSIGQSTRIAMLFDNSASMNANVERTSLLDRSKETAMNLLRNLEGDVVLDVYQTTPFRRAASESVGAVQRLKDIFETISPSAGPDNLWVAVDSAVARSEREEAVSGQSANRGLYVFSDFPTGGAAGWQMNPQGEWRTFLFPQPRVRNNLRIETAGVTSQLKMPDHLLTVETRISNSGDETRADIPVQLFFGEERTGQVVSDLEPNSEKDFAFQAFAEGPGIVHGTVEIPEDDFPIDDRRFFQFRMTDQIRCTILQQNNSDASLLKLALLALNRETQAVELEQFLFGSVGATLLSGQDVVILVDPGALSPGETESLEAFLSDGGSALIFLGPSSEDEGVGTWMQKLDLGMPTGVNRLSGENFLTVESIAHGHPLLAGFPAASLREEMPQIFAHSRLEGYRGEDILLTLSSGDPFLAEKEIGAGRAILFTSPPDLAWTDLPMRGFFVPLLHRMLIYLTADVSGDLEVTVGDELAIPIPREELSKEVIVTSPGGVKTKLVPDYIRERVVVAGLSETGVYGLTLGGELFTTFVANLSSTEDPASRLEEAQLEKLFSSGAMRIVPNNEDAVLAVNEARRGTELWHLFLIFAFVLLGAETWIGRRRSEIS